MDITVIDSKRYRLKVKRGQLAIEIGKSIEIETASNKGKFLISKPGEYEVEGISVFAYAAKDTIASVIHVEDIKILLLAQTVSDALIEEMDTIDVVMIDTNALESKQWVELMAKIEPSIVLPAGENARVSQFVKDFEHSSRETNKLSLSKMTLNSDVTDVVILTD